MISSVVTRNNFRFGMGSGMSRIGRCELIRRGDGRQWRKGVSGVVADGEEKDGSCGFNYLAFGFENRYLAFGSCWWSFGKRENGWCSVCGKYWAEGSGSGSRRGAAKHSWMIWNVGGMGIMIVEPSGERLRFSRSGIGVGSGYEGSETIVGSKS